MRRTRFRKFLNQKGQTAVEYLLLVAVAVTIGMTFKKKMEEFILTNPNSLLSQQLNFLKAQFQTEDRYRTFQLRKF